MHFAILLLLLALLLFGPQWWVGRVLAHYDRRELDFPGNGGELARHLLDRLGLHEVKVEPAEQVGDHYDPVARAVRLKPENLERKTLTRRYWMNRYFQKWVYRPLAKRRRKRLATAEMLEPGR